MGKTGANCSIVWGEIHIRKKFRITVEFAASPTGSGNTGQRGGGTLGKKLTALTLGWLTLKCQWNHPSAGKTGLRTNHCLL